MNTILTHTITSLIGLVIGFIIATQLNCGRAIVDPSINIGTATPKERTVHHEADTGSQVKVIYRDRWRVERLPAEIRTVVDTVVVDSVVPEGPYVARLDTITPLRDTLGVAYFHPAGKFSLDYRPRPDSVRILTVRDTKVVVVESGKKWGLGFSAGPSVQMGTDGVLRAGVSMGVGVNFNLWEP